MEKGFRILIHSLFWISTSCALLFYIWPGLYRHLIKEDGFIEYLTAFLLLILSILLVIRLFRLRKEKDKRWILFNVFMILGLFFVFGEEISWGQRILSVESSDFFKNNNLQSETNLHNLVVFGVKINKVVFTYGAGIILGFYFFFSLLLYRKWRFYKTLIDKFGVPVPGISQIISFIAATLIITTVPDGKVWEIWECAFSCMFFLVLLNPYNKNEKLIVM